MTTEIELNQIDDTADSTFSNVVSDLRQRYSVQALTASELARHYTQLYETDDNDSPAQCRSSMIGEVAPTLYSLPYGALTLDLGAGRQIFEKEMFEKHGFPQAGVLTVDIADISTDQLMASYGPRITQIQADATKLPLLDDSIDAAWSVLAFDFFQPRTNAVAELRRVMRPEAPVFMALHHQESLLSFDADKALMRSNRKLYKQMRWGKQVSRALLLENEVLRQQVGMRDSGNFFTSPDQIVEYFGSRGFKTEYARLAGESNLVTDNWWEVKLVKA